MATKKSLTNNTTSTKLTGTAYLIGRLDHVLNKHLRDGLAPLGLTVQQFTALSVFRSSDSLSNAQLAERTMVSPQSANELVKTLEAKGWIARRPDVTHGKIIRISLTQAGIDLLERCDSQVAELEQAMFPDMSNEDRQQLHELLRSAMRGLTVRLI